MFKGCRPSTSFSGLILSRTCCSSRWGGRGSWTKMPLILGLSCMLRTTSLIYSWEISSLRWEPMYSMPICSHAFFFRRTYSSLSGLFPTSTYPSMGLAYILWDFAKNWLMIRKRLQACLLIILCLSSSLNFSAIALPSMMRCLYTSCTLEEETLLVSVSPLIYLSIWWLLL